MAVRMVEEADGARALARCRDQIGAVGGVERKTEPQLRRIARLLSHLARDPTSSRVTAAGAAGVLTSVNGELRRRDRSAKTTAVPKEALLDEQIVVDDRRRHASARAALLETDAGMSGDTVAEAEQQKQVQAALSTEMLKMVGAFKEIQKETGKALETDAELVVAANKAADANVEKQAKANSQLGEQIKRSGGCWMWLLLLFVACSFLGMVIFMRIF